MVEHLSGSKLKGISKTLAIIIVELFSWCLIVACFGNYFAYESDQF